MQEYRLAVGVVMQRRALNNRWQSESWEAIAVVPDETTGVCAVQSLREDAQLSQWLHTGFAIELFRDEAENYFLNLSSDKPCVFVMWRMEGESALPKTVTLSYGEAARMMDADEKVDNVPLPEPLHLWLEGFVSKYYRPEPKKKRIRPPSFRGARRSDP